VQGMRRERLARLTVRERLQMLRVKGRQWK
jgi:hypothetical protein